MTAASGARWKPVVVAAAAVTFVAVLGGTLTDLGPWYQSLEKPSWQPPGWLFGPAWTLIFALVAMSAVTAWRSAPDVGRHDLWIGLFALNGFLNVLWSLLFFRLQRPDWAMFELVFLWASIVLLIWVLRKYSHLASLILVPYLLWVTFAGLLNWSVLRLNEPF